MAHTITLTDEQFARLQAASHLYNRTLEQVVADLLSGLPEPRQPIAGEEYERRWGEFMQLAGSIRHGKPLTNEEIDELVGEEAADTHAGDATRANTSA
jgi:hypothetical protein